MKASPFSPDLERGRLLPVKKGSRLIDAALKEAYRLYASDKFTRQATKRYLR